MNITLDIVSLARSTNDWRSLYDVFCRLLEEYEKVAKENLKLKADWPNNAMQNTLNRYSTELVQLQADTRKLVETLELISKTFVNSISMEDAHDVLYSIETCSDRAIAEFYEKHPEMKAGDK